MSAQPGIRPRLGAFVLAASAARPPLRVCFSSYTLLVHPLLRAPVLAPTITRLSCLSTHARVVSIPVIAGGGVGTLEHFAEGIIEGEADAVLAASVFHFGTFSIRQVKEYMASQGIPVRLDF